MRRPWIKIETCTPDKPEICSLSTQLRMDEDTVVGKLVRLWSWAELNRIQPNDLGVTREFIDKLVGRKGFALALMQAGWLAETDGKLSFRNFKRHNNPVAQNKALTAKRVARHRLRKAATQEKVTASPLDDAVSEAPQGVIPSTRNEGKERNSTRHEELTIEPLPAPVVEASEVDEIPDFGDDNHDVITPDISLVTNDESVTIDEPESAETVTLSVEPAIAVREVEIPPQITPEEALAVLQLEEPATRKRRSKATADTDDQPMLF
jgi:hypothetical protein